MICVPVTLVLNMSLNAVRVEISPVVILPSRAMPVYECQLVAGHGLAMAR